MAKIHNYRNIGDLEFSIEENKVNFIYGISGTGKSSIASAMTEDRSQEHAPYGKTIDDIELELDFVSDGIAVFDDNSVRNSVYNKDQQGFYEIIYSEDSQIVEGFSTINDLFKGFFPVLERIKTKIDAWSAFKKDIYKINSDNTRFLSGSALTKVASEGERISKEHPHFKIKNGKHVKWVKDGAQFYEDGLCPFCFQTVPELNNGFIQDVKQLDHTAFAKVYESHRETFQAIGVEPSDYDNSQEMMISEIETYRRQIEELTRFYNTLVSYDLDDISGIKEIKLSDETRNLVAGLSDILDEYNEKVSDFKSKLGDLRNKMDVMIGQKKNKINQTLYRVGIPYEFDIQNHDLNTSERSCDYRLKPTGITEMNDVSPDKNLSQGEKSILALIFFLLGNENKVLILDDPVSSYDEQRRGTILNLIYENRKNRTILVLSHDQVFVKIVAFAETFSRPSIIKNDTGVLLHLTNNGGVSICNIDPEDFKSIKLHAKNRFHSTSDYISKLLALRLMSEVDKGMEDDYRDIYCYISGIYHLMRLELGSTDYNEKTTEVSGAEVDALDLIRSRYGIEFEGYNEEKLHSIDYSALTMYETAFVYRMKGRQTEPCYKEVSSWLHLTEAQIITLNPYLYDTMSPTIYRCVGAFRDTMISD